MAFVDLPTIKVAGVELIPENRGSPGVAHRAKHTSHVTLWRLAGVPFCAPVIATNAIGLGAAGLSMVQFGWFTGHWFSLVGQTAFTEPAKGWFS